MTRSSWKVGRRSRVPAWETSSPDSSLSSQHRLMPEPSCAVRSTESLCGGGSRDDSDN